MAKLQIYIEGSLDEDEMQEVEKSPSAHYNKFGSDVVYDNNTTAFTYHGRPLIEFESSENTVRKVHQNAIAYLMLLLTGFKIQQVAQSSKISSRS